MTPKTGQEETAVSVEALEAEIARLEEQAGAARRSVRDAEQRLQEIDERGASIAARSFSGDEEAQQEGDALEDEAVRLSRSLKVARAALEDFGRMIAETKERREQARRAVHERRRAALLDEADALQPRAEELAGQLAGLLERQAGLRGDALQELYRLGDHDQANAELASLRDSNRNWLRGHFGAWLG